MANQLCCIDSLTPATPLIIPHRLPAFLESLMPLKNWCSIHARCSKSSLKHSIHFCGIFSKFKTEIHYWPTTKNISLLSGYQMHWMIQIFGDRKSQNIVLSVQVEMCVCVCVHMSHTHKSFYMHMIWVCASISILTEWRPFMLWRNHLLMDKTTLHNTGRHSNMRSV